MVILSMKEKSLELLNESADPGSPHHENSRTGLQPGRQHDNGNMQQFSQIEGNVGHGLSNGPSNGLMDDAGLHAMLRGNGGGGIDAFISSTSGGNMMHNHRSMLQAAHVQRRNQQADYVYNGEQQRQHNAVPGFNSHGQFFQPPHGYNYINNYAITPGGGIQGHNNVSLPHSYFQNQMLQLQQSQNQAADNSHMQSQDGNTTKQRQFKNVDVLDGPNSGLSMVDTGTTRAKFLSRRQKQVDPKVKEMLCLIMNTLMEIGKRKNNKGCSLQAIKKHISKHNGISFDAPEEKKRIVKACKLGVSCSVLKKDKHSYVLVKQVKFPVGANRPIETMQAMGTNMSLSGPSFEYPESAGGQSTSKAPSDLGSQSMGQYNGMPQSGAVSMFSMPQQAVSYLGMQAHQAGNAGVYQPNSHQAAFAMQHAQHFANGMQQSYGSHISHPYWFQLNPMLSSSTGSAAQSTAPMHLSSTQIQNDRTVNQRQEGQQQAHNGEEHNDEDHSDDDQQRRHDDDQHHRDEQR